MHDQILNGTTVFALCGKGGVGKTSISASLVRILMENPDNKVLAIDADPAVGLATALGMTVSRTVDDIRNDLISRVEQGMPQDKQEVLARLDYEVFSALVEKDNLAFLAIGRPETEGCYCQVNHILKDIIASLAGNFDYVVIDGEAGVEQVNRRVMEKVTHLVLVSDGSAKGLNVVKAIRDVSSKTIEYGRSGLILNRIRPGDEAHLSLPEGLSAMGMIPEDDTIRISDMEEKSILDMEETPALNAIRQCLVNGSWENRT